MKICLLSPEFSAYGGGIATFYKGLHSSLTQSQQHNVSISEGSGFAAFEEPQNSNIDASRLQLSYTSIARWYLRFPHLAATPTLRRLLAAAWAAWDNVRQADPYDVIEVADFGLLHIPHVLKPLAPTVAQCHASWGQIGIQERTRGLELDQSVALALETEGLKHLAGRHTYSEMNAAYWREQTGLPIRMLRPCWEPAVGFQANAGSLEVDDVIRVFGRIQAWKGPKIVAAAWASAPDLPDIDWHGRDVSTDSRGGSTDAQLRLEHAATWGRRIRPRQLVTPEQVIRLQCRSLLNLVPSTWDVFNFTAAEAMASARPVVCSDKAGASELIDDGRTGFVYDGNSPKALVDAIRRAIAMGPSRLSQIGASGRESIIETLRPEAQVRLHLAAYAAAIDAHRPNLSAVPDWFKGIALPREPVGSSNVHLDQVPLREIANHCLDRVLRKVGFTT